MADVKISATGVFFDTKAQKVVESQPEEGVQIVAPGGEVTADAQASIDRWNEVAVGTAPAPEPVEEEEAASETPKASSRSRK